MQEKKKSTRGRDKAQEVRSAVGGFENELLCFFFHDGRGEEQPFG